MVFHRNQAQFERARWRKAFVFPVWLLQIGTLLGLMGIFAYRLAETAEHFEEDNKKGKVPLVELVWECTNVGLSLVALILTILEIARLVSETLTPFFLLASHIVKMTCAGAILGLDIVVYTERSEGNWSIVGLAIDCGLLFSMLLLFVYSIVTFRRVHDDEDMSHPNNVKAFGFGDGYREIEMGNVGNESFPRANPYNDVPTDYPSQAAAAAAAGSEDRTYRGRALSASSSLQRSLSRGHPNPLGSHAVEGAMPDERRASYNHERDTQFEAYMTRASPMLNKQVIDHALSTELWGSAGSYNSIDRSDSVVASGVVSRPVNQPRFDPMNRTASWTVEPGLMTVPEMAREESGSADLGLGAGGVPGIREEMVSDEEDENDEGVSRKTTGQRESRAPLLGIGRAIGPQEEEDDEELDARMARQRIPGPEHYA